MSSRESGAHGRSATSATEERQMGLGAFPAVSLAAARDKAKAARQQLANRIDPIDRRAVERQRARRNGVTRSPPPPSL